MKTFLSAMLIYLLAGCSGIKKTENFPAKLSGTWKPIHLEMGGKPLPEASFANQKLILKDSTYIFYAESEDKGVIKYSGNKMDIFGKEGVNQGKHFTALYKLEAGILTICYNLAGDRYPEDFKTEAKPLYFMASFKKAE